MDIAKYVGLFLLKNEYCFLPGLGSLQIEKKPAVYDKETQKMSAPVFEIKHRQVGGSIDDSFANFIANNERISIAHASNHLKDFCAQAKADLKEGREVVIPSTGKFVTTANGVIQFITEPHLHIEGKAMPFFKNSTSVEQKKEEALSNIIERTNIREPKADEEIEYKAPSVNWGKIILLAAIVLVLLGGVGYLFWYMNNSGKEEIKPAAVEAPATTPPPATTPVPVADSTSAVATTPNNVTTSPIGGIIQNANGTVSYKVLLQQYPSADKANARVAKLKSYGNNNVESLTKDSATYYVAIAISSPIADTARIVDSLKRLFNPAGQVEIAR